MQERWFKFVIGHPIWVIALTVILMTVASMGASNLVFKSDYRVFFSEENPQLQAFEAMQKIYSKSDNVAFVVAPADGQVFTEKNLQAIDELTKAAWQIPYSNRVDSVTNYQYSYAEEDDLIVENLVEDPSGLDEEQLQALKQIALSEPALYKKLISEQAHVSVVNVTVQLPGIDAVTEVPKVALAARELRERFLTQYPDQVVELSGMVMMNTSFPEASLEDNATLVPLMFLVVIVGTALLLKTVVGTLATLLVIVFSIAGTMGLAGWMGFYLTGPSASAPIVILTLAVADCVHLLATQFYEMRQGVEKRKALLDSLKINFQPIMLTSLTTAIGFMSMNFSDSPPFRDLGNMVAMGVILAWLLSISLFPALLSLLPVNVKVVAEDEQPDRMTHLANFVVNRRRILLPFCSAVILVLMAFAPFNETNDDFVKYFDESVPFRQATNFMEENLSGMGSMEISIEAGESSGINQPEFLQVVEQFSNWLRVQPETDHVSTLTDTLKRLNRNMHADDPSYYRLPDEKELSAQYLLLYEMSLPYGLDLNNQLNVDKSATRVIGTFKNMTSNEQIDVEERILDWFATHASQYQIQVASPNLMFAHIGQRNISSMLTGTLFALLLISLLLGVALKSVRYGLISLLPNLAPAAIGFGIWFFLDGQVGLGLSVVAGMTLGIVVDDTVHFLSKYLHARRVRGYHAEKAVHYAFGSVGRALWITTIVLVAGFMVLAQSTFKVNADMGLLTAITIFVALLVDFLFLPPLLMLLDKDEGAAADPSVDNKINTTGVTAS